MVIAGHLSLFLYETLLIYLFSQRCFSQIFQKDDISVGGDVWLVSLLSYKCLKRIF